MIKLHQLGSTVTLFVALLALPATAAANSAGNSIAFVDVTVLPMSGVARIEHMTVVVRNHRIVQIGSANAVKLPRGTVRIDGRGRYLMPGLSDMHAHVFNHDGPERFRGERQTVAKLEMLSYLATGVTTVRDMAGSPFTLRYRKLQAEGRVTGPRLVVCSPIIEGAKQVWPFSVKITNPEKAEQLVAGFAAAGYDQIKIYHTISAPVFEAVISAAARHHIKVVGHIPFEVGLKRAVEAGQYGVEHLRGYDFDGMSAAQLEKDGGRSPERFGSWLQMSDARMSDLSRFTVAHHAWNTPTLVVQEYLANPMRRAAVQSDSNYALLTKSAQDLIRPGPLDAVFSPQAKEAIRSSLPRQRLFLKALSDAGAGLLIGTDTPAPFLARGFTPIDEMEEFAAAGISTQHALRAATLNAAIFLGIERESGTVEVGKRTDLILLDGDPSADLSNLWKLVGVLSNGRWHYKTALVAEIAALQRGRGLLNDLKASKDVPRVTNR